MYKVSVIIPLFNSEKYIQQTIESVLQQTYAKIEIIIVDDHSSDSSFLLAKKYECESVKIYQNPKKGACAARNYGFQHCSGDLIQFLDADDLLDQFKIENQIKSWNGDEKVILNGRWGRFYTSDPLNEEIKWGPNNLLQKDLESLEWLLCSHMSQTACWLTPRILIEKAGPWNESLLINQDGEFFSRVVAKSKMVKFCNDARVYYRSSINSSITANQLKEDKVKSKFNSLELIEKTIFELEFSSRTKLICANNYQKLLYFIYPRYHEIIAELQNKIAQLGGSSLKFKDTPLTQKLSKITGWKLAKRIKNTFGKR
jgi:glycosyltransferase involved in cell wall biosynthesis